VVTARWRRVASGIGLIPWPQPFGYPLGVSGRDSLRASTLVWLALVLVVSLLLRAPGIGLPLERDEGEYAYVAQHWLAGEPPYMETFSQKPPGITATYALAFALGGETPSAARWAAAIATAATLLILFALVRRLISEPAGLVAAAFCGLLCADPAFLGNAANTELFMLPLLTASLLASLRAAGARSVAWSAVAGALGGAALLFKQPAAPNLLLAALLATAGGGIAGAGRRMLAFGLGAAAAVAPVPIYFAAVGALRGLWDSVVGYNLNYATVVRLDQYAEAIRLSFPRSLRPFTALYLLAVIGVVTASVRVARGTAAPEVRRSAAVLLAWLAASVLGVSVGGYFREHYYLQAAPPLAALAALGASEVVVPLLALRRREPVLVALVILVIGLAVLATPAYYLSSSPESRSLFVYHENPFLESPVVASFIAGRTSPEESVFIFGSEPQILFLAKRRAASRYLCVYPLMLPTADARRRQQEALAEIRRAAPAMIVTTTVGTSFLRSAQSPYDLFLGLRAMLRRDYRLVARVPEETRGALEAVSPEAAERAWTADPGLGNPQVWGRLAVWERVRADVSTGEGTSP